MRKRIKTRVNIQEVIDQIESNVSAHTKMIKDLMVEKNITYNEAKFLLNGKRNNDHSEMAKGL